MNQTEKDLLASFRARIDSGEEFNATLLTRYQRLKARYARESAAGASLDPHFRRLWDSIVKKNAMNVEASPVAWCLDDGITWGDDGVVRLLIRENWQRMADFILTHHPLSPLFMIMKGKAGRGKSVFLKYLIFRILLDAKARAAQPESAALPKYSTNPTIVYVERSKQTHFITLHSITPYPTTDEKPHYYFSDSVDIETGTYRGMCATMALSSGDIALPECNKRMMEGSGSEKGRRIVSYMSSLSIEEMKHLFREIDEEEVEFRYNVIGGNPRRFLRSLVPDKSAVYYLRVQAVTEKVFPGESKQHQEWATNIVAATIGMGEKSAADSSLFRDYVVSGEYCEKNKLVFASMYMGLVASMLLSGADMLFQATLQRLFGSSWFGNYFEYQAHLALLNADENEQYCCVDRHGNCVFMPLGGGQVRLIRSITDLATLSAGHYGMPTTQNFAIVDSLRLWSERSDERNAIVTRKVGLQMTIADRHQSSVLKLPEMLTALSVTANNFTIVFVVPDDHVNAFSFPTNLGDVQMYLTMPHPCALEAMKGYRAKRKL